MVWVPVGNITVLHQPLWSTLLGLEIRLDKKCLVEYYLFSLQLKAVFLNLVLLAPTGALIVTVVYIEIQKLFEISSISANIFSFSFCELNAD